MPRFCITTTETVRIVARYYVDAADKDTAIKRVNDRYCRPHSVTEHGDKDSVVAVAEPSNVTDEQLRSLGKPAITSNQAAMWYSLRRCGIKDQIPALGRLFQLDLPQTAARERIAATA